MDLTLFFFWYILTWTFFMDLSGLDFAQPWQMGFQDSATPVMEGIINLHHDLMFFLTVIAFFVGWMLFRTVYLFNEKRNPVPSRRVHGTFLEIVWTVTPSLILMVIAVPSFALLYSIDEVATPALTVKVIGHQWYWTYEYSDLPLPVSTPLNFDSYMIAEEDLEPGQLRLLDVDNPVVVPVNTHIRFLITAADVIHCWAVPSLGIKLDAIPGRLNQVSTFINRTGVYYGQCSEICGVNHGFMPIAVQAVHKDQFVNWIADKLGFSNVENLKKMQVVDHIIDGDYDHVQLKTINTSESSVTVEN
nr:cytochrome c oxidase subunit 2 [Microheliella maris]